MLLRIAAAQLSRGMPKRRSKRWQKERRGVKDGNRQEDPVLEKAVVEAKGSATKSISCPSDLARHTLLREKPMMHAMIFGRLRPREKPEPPKGMRRLNQMPR
jgi:hypothetical protein